MPRTPNTTCGTCGKPCYRSRARAGSDWIPPLTHTCNSCRRVIAHGEVATYKKRGCRCDLCRAAWAAANARHARAWKLRNRPPVVRECVECGTEFNPRSNQVTCSPKCRKVYLGRYGTHYSRAEFFGVAYEVVPRAEIFERDGWTCGICELPVDPAVKFPDPGSATLDHVVPMSLGGSHTRENLQCAHFYCNTLRGAREVAAC